MKKYIETTRKFYDDHVDEFMENTLDLQYTYWFDRYRELLPEKAVVLDIGCAYGRDCKSFSSWGFDAYGVDLSPRMIEKAKEFSPNSKFQVMNVLDLNFDTDMFDGVWCSSILLHLAKKDVDIALQGIRRILKNNGILFICLKEGNSEGIVNDSRYDGAEKYYSYFEEDELKSLLTDSGFKIVEFEIVEHRDPYRGSTRKFYLFAKKVHN